MLNLIRIGLVGLSVIALLGCGSENFTGQYASSKGDVRYIYTFEGDGTARIATRTIVGGNESQVTFDYEADKGKLILKLSEAQPKLVLTIEEDGTITGGGGRLYPVVNSDFLKDGYWMFSIKEDEIEHIIIAKYEGVGNDGSFKEVTNIVTLNHQRAWYAKAQNEYVITCSPTESINSFNCNDEEEDTFLLEAVNSTKNAIDFIRIRGREWASFEYTEVRFAKKPDFPIPAGYEERTEEEFY